MAAWSENFLQVRQGDLVEFHLRNHETSIAPHNIDLQAVTGPGSGDGGPNLVSSFQVIGEIFDNAYAEAGSAPTHNAQRAGL